MVFNYVGHEDAAAEVVRTVQADDGHAHAVRLDLADPGGPEHLTEAAEAYLGGLDILVNNAAVTHPPALLAETDAAVLDKVMAVNTRSVFLTLRAVEQLTAVAARELGPRGITVSTVSPAATDPQMLHAANPPDVLETVAGMTPFGRLGQPADVADAVGFLAGHDGRWITGQNLRATGGLA